MTGRRWFLVLLVLGLVGFVAFSYLGPSVALTVAFRALIASVVYRLVRRLL